MKKGNMVIDMDDGKCATICRDQAKAIIEYLDGREKRQLILDELQRHGIMEKAVASKRMATKRASFNPFYKSDSSFCKRTPDR